MAAEAAAGAIGGATPFGWAGLAASVLGAGSQKTPAGPSSADAIFGGGMFSVDSSNWMVNFGDGATQGMTGDRQGPSMSQPQTYDRQPTPVIQPPSYAGPGAAGSGGSFGGTPGYTGAPAGAPGGMATIAGIPVLWLLIGAGVFLVMRKK